MTRGEGERQRKDRQFTISKVVAYLSVSPFTYQQLQEESKIQKQTLREILDRLVMQKIVIKHRFTMRKDGHIPYNSKYYLLNLKNNKCRELVQYYYSQKKEYTKEEISILSLLLYNNKLDATTDDGRSLSADTISRAKKDGEIIDRRLALQDLRDQIIASHDKYCTGVSDKYHKKWNIDVRRVERKLELLNVMGQIEADSPPEPSKDKIHQALELVKIGLDRKYHFLDIMIKDCVDDKIKLGMFNYTELWKILEKESLLDKYV